LCGAIEEARRRRGIELRQATGLAYHTGKQLAIYMLVLRRASKIRSSVMRSARLATPTA